MDNSNFSNTKILYNLFKMRNTVKHRLKIDTRFEPLLESLYNWNLGSGEVEQYPTIKELASLTATSYDKIRTQLQQLYKEIIDQSEINDIFSFNKIEYVFCINANKNFLAVKVKYLPMLPRVGDGVKFPFFSAYFDSNDFYVDNVDHDFMDETQTVFINLVKGYFNPYWYFRKAEGIEKGELNYEDLRDLDEYDLKNKLQLKKYMI